MEITPILKQFGLSEKEIKVYLVLIENGPDSVRKLAEKSGLNRGTAYDILKSLKEIGLVSYYHKETKQFFAAEDPIRLLDALEKKSQNLVEVKSKLLEVIPQLKSLQGKSGDKPVVKYYEGNQGIKSILSDVLETVQAADQKTYCVFSSSAIRKYLYQAFPNFTKQRVKKGLAVKVIAMGHPGTKAELAEFKSLTAKEGPPTYTLIYSGKVAMISVNSKNEPLGLIIEDRSIFETQKQLFNYIWQTL